MDALSDVLRLVRLKGCVYFLSDFTAPWGMEMDAGPFAQFHVVVRGQCWLKSDGDTRMLRSGDVAIFPLGGAHWMADDPDSDKTPGLDVLRAHGDNRPMFQGGAEGARLLCGHFEFDRTHTHPLIMELPPLMHIQEMSRHQPGWLETVTAFLVRETDSQEPGSDTVIDRLAEVLFIQALRAHLIETAPTTGFMAAVQDKRLNDALKVIHSLSDTDLTLSQIAKSAGMSRSTLAARFKETLGVPPMSYLTTWRMLRARELLRSPDFSLAEVAERVGYTSEAAFNRAFRREFDQTPGLFRRAAEVS